MNMTILSVLTTPSIYHGCSTRKTFWEETFTPVNMIFCSYANVRENREIKNGEKYITLDMYLNFGSLDKMKITSSEPKQYLVR